MTLRARTNGISTRREDHHHPCLRLAPCPSETHRAYGGRGGLLPTAGPAHFNLIIMMMLVMHLDGLDSPSYCGFDSREMNIYLFGCLTSLSERARAEGGRGGGLVCQRLVEQQTIRAGRHSISLIFSPGTSSKAWHTGENKPLWHSDACMGREGVYQFRGRMGEWGRGRGTTAVRLGKKRGVCVVSE